MSGGSLFTIGENVELARVLKYLSLLVVFVMVLEQLLHKIKSKLEPYPKYLDMVNKIFGELMVLGFVGLVLKAYKEASLANAYSKPMIAFQAADLTIFILAMALIVQAICVFVLLRRKNVQVDKAELVSSAHLLDAITKSTERKGDRSLSLDGAKDSASGKTTTRIHESDYPELLRMRLLRHLFLRTHGLPELFPFSKYLRQAQDNQLTHMIDVEMSTWIVLLAIAWGLEALARIVRELYGMSEQRAIVYAFVLLSWLSVLLHVAVLAYMRWAIEQLLSAAGEQFGRSTQLKCLRAVAEQETRTVDAESVADAFTAMERVLEAERRKKVAHHHSRLTRHDTGFQLLATICRGLGAMCCCASRRESNGAAAELAAHDAAEAGVSCPATAPRSSKDALFLRWFSRKAWHFVVMALLMLNAFYVALFFQCVLYELVAEFDELGAMLVALTPVPCVLNVVFFHSRILRAFVLVSSIVRVDDAALGDVIGHFTETVRLRAEFVATVTAFLDASRLTVADLEAELRAKDARDTGLLEVEDVRVVLQRFGFTLSYFRFSSVAKLLFRLHGTQVEYAQVKRLLTLTHQHDAVRSLYNDTRLSKSKSTSRLGGGGDNDGSGDELDVAGSLSRPVAARPLPLVRRASSRAARSLYQLDYTDVELVETMVHNEREGEATTEKATHARL